MNENTTQHISTRAPLPEALAQVERILRADADNAAWMTRETALECADVIRRALQEAPLHHDDCEFSDLPLYEDHVAVPIEYLELLKEWVERNDGSPFDANGINIVDTYHRLIECLPEPPFEPDPDLVTVVADQIPTLSINSDYTRDEVAVEILRAIHEAGIELPEAD